MTFAEIITMMDDIKALTSAEYAYDHFAEGEAPNPPFICFLMPESRDFIADDTNYFKQRELDIELYTDAKNPGLEELIEAELENYEFVYSKTETWIESERLYEVLYEMTV